jgi:short-subunit dehydrogenase involved in D-alanine esterification of teichoic acids
LDIGDGEAIKDLAREIGKSHPDGIAAIINNAGININPEGYSQKTVMSTMKVNYYGTKLVSLSSAPYLHHDTRFTPQYTV